MEVFRKRGLCCLKHSIGRMYLTTLTPQHCLIRRLLSPGRLLEDRRADGTSFTS